MGVSVLCPRCNHAARVEGAVFQSQAKGKAAHCTTCGNTFIVGNAAPEAVRGNASAARPAVVEQQPRPQATVVEQLATAARAHGSATTSAAHPPQNAVPLLRVCGSCHDRFRPSQVVHFANGYFCIHCVARERRARELAATHAPAQAGRETGVRYVNPDRPTGVPMRGSARSARYTRTWSPTVAAVMSLLVPGAGQMYKGEFARGLLWFVAVAAGYRWVWPGIILHFLCIYNAAVGRRR